MRTFKSCGLVGAWRLDDEGRREPGANIQPSVGTTEEFKRGGDRVRVTFWGLHSGFTKENRLWTGAVVQVRDGDVLDQMTDFGHLLIPFGPA